MGISVGGIVSGIDTESLIAGLVAAYSIPKTVMEDHLADVEEEQEAFAGLNTRLGDLLATLDAFASSDDFYAWSATSSDESVLGVTASSGAVAGTYTVTVNSLASSASTVSQGYADKDTGGVVGTGTFSLTYGSTTTAIAVDNTMSLEDLATAINEQADGVTAYVMDTGDATEPYRLVLAGDDTGAANTITVDTSGLTGGTAPTFTETSAASDAEITLNGITVTDSDNTFDSAVPGVTFTAEAVSADPVTVTVEADVSGMSDKVQAMVDAYNTLRSYVATKSVYNADEDIKGPFVGEGLVTSITQSLSQLVTAQYGSGSTVDALSKLGISTQQDGSLEFDTEAFETAFAANPDDVVSLFTDTTSGFGAAFGAKLEELTDEDSGPLDARNDSLDDEIQTTEDRISNFEDAAAAYEERLRRQFAAMEVAMGQLQSATAALAALMPSESSSS